MLFDVYNLEQSEQWDSVVRSFKEFDVYWLSGYVKAFMIHGDGEPLLLYYHNSAARGINVVMKRDIADDDWFKGKIEKGVYFDLITPYGYGGWIIEGKETDELFCEYEQWAVNKGFISEFVRFHPLIKNHIVCQEFYDVSRLGEVVHMDISSQEEIWQNITSKNRNMIRKARKNGICIYNGRFPEIFKSFRSIYNATMDKDNAKEYYYFEEAFYESIMNELPHNAQVFWAEKEKQIIAASIILAANGKLNYHLSGSIREYSSFAPTNLLLYEAALWGCANGYRSFLLGGGVGAGEDNLFKFKKAFYKGDLNHYYIGKKIYDEEKYSKLLNKKTKIENLGFFPEYRG